MAQGARLKAHCPWRIAVGYVSLYVIIFKTYLYINYSMPPIEANAPKRRMPVIDPEKRARIFQRMHEIRGKIIDGYHKDIFISDLAKAIATGNRSWILKIMRNHPFIREEIYKKTGALNEHTIQLLKFLRELYVDTLSQLPKDMTKATAYHEKKAAIRRYLSELKEKMPYTSKTALSALNILHEAMKGQQKTRDYAYEIAWIGEMDEREYKPLKIVLAFSGGSAKGIFYSGFIKAIQEEGLWPDIVVGTSAGALAAAALGSGKNYMELERLFSPKTLMKIFSPASALFTLPASAFSGVIGRGFGRHLKRMFRERTFSDIADVFVITTIQQPTNFGKAVIGTASQTNGELTLSSDIEVWRGVWGSCAMQGIIPRPTVNRFNAERLTSGEFGPEVHNLWLPYAALDDGGVVENLPLITAELLLERLKEDGLIIGVNLADLSPTETIAPHYRSLKESINGEIAKLGKDARWYRKPIGFFKGMGVWIKQETKRLVKGIAPLRAYGAFEAAFAQNVIQTIDIVKGTGLKILINPNVDGKLSEIEITSFSDAEKIKEQGYQTGKELARILLGD